ncbi:penicillin-binding protein activator [Vibrio methylphosphonaticus]|uniref:penicillin-binding protein activator n=1 Tax=Vibrio methylphosphonaticus TaxID=2946866 RepID=UPI00202A4571|nr:penicillin-binding protein activator [Vibrio methylphosphonaticus]MCL9773400.1 penicillin-binding protein activator [Vibrio methylphosphonaticus]
MAMMNRKKNSVTRLLTPIALALSIAACSTQPSAPTSVDITMAPTASSETYLMRADSDQGGFANEWLILAFKASIQEGNYDQAQRLSNRLAKQNLSTIQQAEWQLARAELSLAQGKAQEAYLGLNLPVEWPLPQQQWMQYHNLRGQSLAIMGDYVESSREYIAMSGFAPREQQQNINDNIWQNLNQYSAEQLSQLTIKPEEDILDGWVQLASYMKALGSSLPQLQNTLEKWLAENNNHPAALYTPQSIYDILSLEISTPHSTALLLPLTGKYAKQAQLVRDGFMMATMDDEQRDPDATFTVIDTNEATPAEIKARLIANDVDFIVGPLIKDNVEKLQQAQLATDTPIPALALNIPTVIEPSQSMCYLTLSPEQEVSQAAKHLAQENYAYPLILAPKSSLGNRVVKAFEEEWSKLSTNNIAVAQYSNRAQLQKTINNVFGLQDSQQRIAQMETLTGLKLENQPRSRRDIDSVYIVANGADLTLIKPFIEVAINPDANQPKLFADSHSNSSKRQYEDLTGVVYSDIPMLIEEDEQLDAQMTKFWPKSSNAEKRLQALGMDAYALTKELPQLKAVEGYSVDGQTGTLSIDGNCVVQRQIAWGVHGQAKSQTTDAPEEATDNATNVNNTDESGALEQNDTPTVE